MYIDGDSDISIKQEIGIHETRITKLIEKCARIDPATNEPYGYAINTTHCPVLSIVRYEG